MTRWGCRDCHTQFGAWLSRCPRCGSPKELEMALNACTGCTTKFAVGLPRCPHCGSTEYVEDGQPMAKITVHGGPSDKTLPVAAEVRLEPGEHVLSGDAVREHARNLVEPDHAESLAHPDVEGGEESSPGSSSSASTETPQPNSEPSSKQTPKRARGTASRSGKARTGSSSAPSTVGSQGAGTSAADGQED